MFLVSRDENVSFFYCDYLEIRISFIEIVLKKIVFCKIVYETEVLLIRNVITFSKLSQS